MVCGVLHASWLTNGKVSFVNRHHSSLKPKRSITSPSLSHHFSCAFASPISTYWTKSIGRGEKGEPILLTTKLPVHSSLYYYCQCSFDSRGICKDSSSSSLILMTNKHYINKVNHSLLLLDWFLFVYFLHNSVLCFEIKVFRSLRKLRLKKSSKRVFDISLLFLSMKKQKFSGVAESLHHQQIDFEITLPSFLSFLRVL